MSERERWIVYPLVFLALGASLRDKLVDRTMSKSIVCQEITVVDEEPLGRQPGRVLAKIGRAPSPGSPSRGFLYIDGELEVVQQVAGRQPLPVLVARAQSAPGSVPRAIVTVSGLFNVDGVINANQYAIQGQPFLNAIQSLLPVPLGNFFRVVPQPPAAGAAENPPGETDEAGDADQPASTPAPSSANEPDSAAGEADRAQPN